MHPGGSRGIWRNREFVKLWSGTSVSSIGSQVTVLAMPLIAVLLYGAGPAETGLLTAAGYAPNLLFGLPAGALVDRFNLRSVRVAADLACAVVVASIPVAFAFGVLRIEYLYAVVFISGTFTVFRRLAQSALLPSVVPPRDLLAANSAMITSFSFALISGPALAGWLVQFVPAPTVLLIDACSYVVSAACYAVMRELPATGEAERKRTNLGQEIGEGLRWLMANSILLRLTLAIGMANLAWFAVQAVLVPFASRDLQLEPGVIGLTIGLIGPAGLVGALIAGWAARRFGLGPTLVFSLSGEFVSRILIVVAGGPPATAVLALSSSMLVFGFIAPLWDVNANSLRQVLTPRPLLGRVSAASGFVAIGTAPIGALLGGWIGQAAGPRATFGMAAVVTLGALGLLITSNVPRLRTPQGL